MPLVMGGPCFLFLMPKGLCLTLQLMFRATVICTKISVLALSVFQSHSRRKWRSQGPGVYLVSSLPPLADVDRAVLVPVWDHLESVSEGQKDEGG